MKEHAELKSWFPGPPIALQVLAAELVTPFGVLSHFEVEGIFLKQKFSIISEYDYYKSKDHILKPGIGRTRSTSWSQICSFVCPLLPKSVFGENIPRF